MTSSNTCQSVEVIHVLERFGMLANNYGHRERWRQLVVVVDERTTVVHMTPALLGGWNVQWVDVSGPDAWPGMSADRIVAWKEYAGHDHELASDESAAWIVSYLRTNEQGGV